MVTYGDGVGNVDVGALLAFHRSHGKLATVTAVRPPARFGELVMDGVQVQKFAEKPQISVGWINGGFFVFQPEIFDYLGDDATPLEGRPLERLSAEGQLMAYEHRGFWHPMDTLRDKRTLEAMVEGGNPPWSCFP
jgi:glucose-1-phosphate cytidylyltransferase